MGAVTVSRAFGQVLLECRLKSGLSQEKLALAASLDRTYISLLERGLRQPTLTTVFKIAEILEIAPATMISKTAAALRQY